MKQWLNTCIMLLKSATTADILSNSYLVATQLFSWLSVTLLTETTLKKDGGKFWYPWSTGIKVGFFIAVKVFPNLSLAHTYISRFEHVFWDINTEYKILALENEIFCYLSKQSSFSSELNIHDREQPCTWSY